MSYLACADSDPEMFFGPVDSRASAPPFAWERRALAVCARCPVQAGCLTEALRYPAADQHGVVGGMTAGQRRVLLARSARATRKGVAA